MLALLDSTFVLPDVSIWPGGGGKYGCLEIGEATQQEVKKKYYNEVCIEYSTRVFMHSASLSYEATTGQAKANHPDQGGKNDPIKQEKFKDVSLCLKV